MTIKAQTSITDAQRIALIAVRNGAVRLDAQGCRIYPEGVSGVALSACQRRGWFAWNLDERIAYVTQGGIEALR